MLNNNENSCIKPIKLLLLSITLATPALAQASETSISFKYEQSLRENKYYQPEVGLAHRFDNNLAINFLQKRRWRESEKESGFPALHESTVGVAYGIPLGENKSLTLTPKLDYQFKHRQEIIRPSLRLYYKIDSTWGAGVRYRYEYQVHNGVPEKLSRMSRYDLYLDYNVTDKLRVSWNPIYIDLAGSGGGTFYTNKNYRVEHWFSSSYKINTDNAIGITYKRKDKTFEGAKYNGNEHDDVILLSYTHKF